MEQNLQYDVGGYDVMSTALRDLLNEFPLLERGEMINFSTIGNEEGIAFFPTSGAIIQRNLKDVTGHIEQTCVYPFMVMYKASGLSQKGKINAKEWLDTLGEWLERQIITIDGVQYQLKKYPLLNGTRKFEKIERSTPAFLNDTTEDKVDSWMIYINAIYKNEYQEI